MKGHSSSKPIPYVAFTTFLTTLDALGRVRGGTAFRREHVKGIAYASWCQLSTTLRALNLVDDEMMPTHLFRSLFIGERKAKLIKVLRQHYGDIIGKLSQLTPERLDDLLKVTYGISGTTVTKVRSFLLGATRYCGIPLSPQLSATVRGRSSKKHLSGRKKTSRGNFHTIEPRLSKNKTLSLTADDMTVTVSFRRGALPEISKMEHELMARLFSELLSFTARAKKKNRHLRSVPRSWSPPSDDGK